MNVLRDRWRIDFAMPDRFLAVKVLRTCMEHTSTKNSYPRFHLVLRNFSSKSSYTQSSENQKTRSKIFSYIFSKKVFFIFQEMELSSPKIKKVLIFSQKKLFLYFRKWNFPALRIKYFRRELSDLEKQKKNLSEKFLIFQETELCSLKLKKLL